MVLIKSKGLKEMQTHDNVVGSNEESTILIGSVKVEFSRLAKMYEQIEAMCCQGEEQVNSVKLNGNKDTE